MWKYDIYNTITMFIVKTSKKKKKERKKKNTDSNIFLGVQEPKFEDNHWFHLLCLSTSPKVGSGLLDLGPPVVCPGPHH